VNPSSRRAPDADSAERAGAADAPIAWKGPEIVGVGPGTTGIGPDATGTGADSAGIGPVEAGEDHPGAAGSAGAVRTAAHGSVPGMPTETGVAMAAGSTCTVPPSCAWAMLSAAARIGDVPEAGERSALGGALSVSFGRSDVARNLTASPSAVTAIANP
jgi:hypothetical protein